VAGAGGGCVAVGVAVSERGRGGTEGGPAVAALVERECGVAEVEPGLSALDVRDRGGYQAARLGQWLQTDEFACARDLECVGDDNDVDLVVIAADAEARDA
jgi:hypothetical protein